MVEGAAEPRVAGIKTRTITTGGEARGVSPDGETGPTVNVRAPRTVMRWCHDGRCAGAVQIVVGAGARAGARGRRGGRGGTHR